MSESNCATCHCALHPQLGLAISLSLGTAQPVCAREVYGGPDQAENICAASNMTRLVLLWRPGHIVMCANLSSCMLQNLSAQTMAGAKQLRISDTFTSIAGRVVDTCMTGILGTQVYCVCRTKCDFKQPVCRTSCGRSPMQGSRHNADCLLPAEKCQPPRVASARLSPAAAARRAM